MSRPLTSLPALEQLELGSSPIKDLTPLLSLPKLKSLTGRIDPDTAAALRERGVKVTVTKD